MQSIAYGPRRARRAVIAAALLALPLYAFGVPAGAQDVPTTIRERSDNLDVPFVPSSNRVLDAMFAFAKPTPDDFVIDLGSGDGRIVITAAKKFGARGFGVDLNGGLVKIANERARRAGVADRAKFHERNLFVTDIRQASILTAYLLPEVMLELQPKILRELRPGTRVVSHDYHMGAWRPDGARVLDAKSKDQESVVYYWVVPASLAGEWRWEISYPRYFAGSVEYTAFIQQEFQDISGELDIEGLPAKIHAARVVGSNISFSTTSEIDERIVSHAFEGVVDGDRIEGKVRLSGGVRPVELVWRARRYRGGE